MAGMRVEVCPDEGRAMRSSPLRRQAQRFGRRHSQPPIEFPCSAPQRDGKSPKTTGNPANVGLGEAMVKSCTLLLALFSFMFVAILSGITRADTYFERPDRTCPEQRKPVLIVFVHGVVGSAETWKADNGAGRRRSSRVMIYLRMLTYWSMSILAQNYGHPIVLVAWQIDWRLI